MKRLAIYAGTFDPFTKGHEDIVCRSLGTLCDHLFIVIGVNNAKKTLFTVEERRVMIYASLNSNKVIQGAFSKGASFSVVPISDLLVDFAKEVQATILIRGIRNFADFEYESNLAQINHNLCPSVHTVFLPTRPELSTVSSSAVKELARFNALIDNMVSKEISIEVANKIRGQ